jgi:hypothetical protein
VVLHLGYRALLGFYAVSAVRGFEHFAHLNMPAEEVVDLLHRCA